MLLCSVVQHVWIWDSCWDGPRVRSIFRKQPARCIWGVHKQAWSQQPSPVLSPPRSGIQTWRFHLTSLDNLNWHSCHVQKHSTDPSGSAASAPTGNGSPTCGRVFSSVSSWEPLASYVTDLAVPILKADKGTESGNQMMWGLKHSPPGEKAKGFLGWGVGAF